MAGPGYPSNWEELRQQQLQHDNHRCCTCGITAKQLTELGWAPLQVHHIIEGPPRYAGPYRREVVGTNLMTLCPDCPDGVTDSVRKGPMERLNIAWIHLKSLRDQCLPAWPKAPGLHAQLQRHQRADEWRLT